MARSTKSVDYQKVARPVAALVDEYPSGFVDPKHSHQRAQLIFATSGVMTITTDEASFVIPPQRALWIPPNLEHEAVCRGPVSLKTLYIDMAARPNLPKACRAIEVSSLLRELIVEATQIPIEYDESGRDGRIMNLILDEITATTPARLHVPMPSDARLARACKAILANPADTKTLDDLARSINMGRRTFTRLFRHQTGMSFAAWRQHVRLMEALARLATGQRVTNVAFDIGYNSPSAFTAMFRRTFGVSPSHYFEGMEEPESR
ncbi:MAG: helix-turn-helix transcriptional regulator [Micropepsaceae bacterium]